MANNTRISNTGTVTQGLGDDASVQVNPVNQSVGAGIGSGDVRVGAGINAQGQANVGVGTQTGEGNISAGLQYDPKNPTGTNIGVGYQSDTGGDVQFGINAGYNVASGSFGVTPTVTIGDTKEAQTGGQVGATAGTIIGGAIGGPIGAAAGSLIGSAVGSVAGGQFTHSIAQEEENKRDTIINRFKDNGIWGEDYTITNPDGTTFKFGDDGERAWKDPSRRVDKEGDRGLYNYETDYTSDLDYLSGMAGISLSRSLNGGTNKAIDQVGNEFGNAFLGGAKGKEFNQETFNQVMGNARAGFAKSGIKSKEDYLALANQAFGQGRINDTDYAVMQQTAQLVYDNNFGVAQQLMGGRWKGVEAAGKTPSQQTARTQTPGRGGSRVRSPYLTGEEAQASVQPLLDIYRAAAQRAGVNGASQGLRNAARLSQAAGLVSGAAGAYRGINQATGGALNEYIKDGFQGLREAVGAYQSEETVAPEVSDVGTYDDYGTIDGQISEGEYDLGSDSSVDFGYNAEDADYDLSY